MVSGSPTTSARYLVIADEGENSFHGGGAWYGADRCQRRSQRAGRVAQCHANTTLADIERHHPSGFAAHRPLTP